MKALIFVLVLLLFLGQLIPGPVSAMSSANYRMDWSNFLTGGAAGHASSGNYAVSITLGQSVVGNTISPNYKIGMGFWNFLEGYFIYLPLILKN